MKDIIHISKKLKRTNPVKFLEVMPEVVSNYFFERLNLAGFSNNFFNEIINKNIKTIDKRIKENYNLNRIILGSAIFLAGCYINKKIFRKEE